MSTRLLCRDWHTAVNTLIAILAIFIVSSQYADSISLPLSLHLSQILGPNSWFVNFSRTQVLGHQASRSLIQCWVTDQSIIELTFERAHATQASSDIETDICYLRVLWQQQEIESICFSENIKGRGGCLDPWPACSVRLVCRKVINTDCCSSEIAFYTALGASLVPADIKWLLWIHWGCTEQTQSLAWRLVKHAL